ncbi:MAG: HD-GYP domain-containing protein, partial [Acetivibrionales bacterium]
IVGYRLLNLFDNTLDLAEYVYNHHERWDGKGYPSGLKGEEIPLISRIISVAETYERILRREATSNPQSKEKAVQEIKDGSGTQFDPMVVGEFVRMIEEKTK